jgi:hypothetical protein
VEDAKRFIAEFLEYVGARVPEIGEHIKSKGDLPDELETKLKSEIADFKGSFQPTEAAAGSAVAAGEGSTPDEMKEDVGWDRMSAEGDEGQDDESSGS